MINLLIIDDDQDLLTLLSAYFLDKGIRVLTASSFTEGIRQSQRKRIDVVITDYQLGDGDGTDLLSQFRKTHPEAKLIMISAHRSPHLSDTAAERGASTFLPKPLNLELLGNWVSTLSAKEAKEAKE